MVRWKKRETRSKGIDENAEERDEGVKKQAATA